MKKYVIIEKKEDKIFIAFGILIKKQNIADALYQQVLNILWMVFVKGFHF